MEKELSRVCPQVSCSAPRIPEFAIKFSVKIKINGSNKSGGIEPWNIART